MAQNLSDHISKLMVEMEENETLELLLGFSVEKFKTNDGFEYYLYKDGEYVTRFHGIIYSEPFSIIDWNEIFQFYL